MSKIRHSTVARIITLGDGDDQDVDPHRCLAGERCRDSQVTTAENGFTQKSPAITERPDSVCRRCYSAIRLAVEDLPQDRIDLLSALGDRQPIAGEKVHGSANGSQSPLDLMKHDLAREIEHQLRIAAARVHRARQTKDTPPKPIGACSQLVAKHLQLLITSPTQLEQEWCGQGESILIAGQYQANTRTVEHTGIDTAMKLVDLRSKARARLNGITTNMWRLPPTFPGCTTCGERLHTNGHKVVCRPCDKDWTEQNGGLFNAEIKRQAQIEKQERMDELEAQINALTAKLAVTTDQLNTAWGRLDAVQRFVDNLPTVLPVGIGLSANQITATLSPYLEGHLPPDEREMPTETTE